MGIELYNICKALFEKNAFLLLLSDYIKIENMMLGHRIYQTSLERPSGAILELYYLNKLN